MSGGARRIVVNLMVDSHAAAGGDARPVSIGGLKALDMLRAQVLAAGHDFLGAPEVRAAPGRDELVVLWDFGSVTRMPRWLRARRPIGIVAWSLESPLVAHRAYHRLPAIARQADAVFAFPGAVPLAEAPDRTRLLQWPNDPRPVSPGRPWRDRRLLVLINSNKRARPGLESVDLRSPYRSARVLAASLLSSSYAARGTWTTQDLYEERLRAVNELAASGTDFTLHGVGWDRGGFPSWLPRESVARVYRGPVADKDAALQEFKFALVVENTKFPGYVSEKIFDCFYNRTIPVYYGAPDIARHVPPATFIDGSAFSSYTELAAFLRDMSVEDAAARHAAAAGFLSSPQFAPFTAEHFAREVGAALGRHLCGPGAPSCAG